MVKAGGSPSPPPNAPRVSGAAWSATRARNDAARGMAAGGASAAAAARRGGAHGAHEWNGMNLRLKQTPGIYLLGFMATGKSTVDATWRTGWLEFLRSRRRNRGSREDDYRAHFRYARRSRVPPHRERNAGAARTFD